MSIDEVENLKQLIAEHKRRLQVLEKQEAIYGSSVDPRILIEIDDIKVKISSLESVISKIAQSASQRPPAQEDKGLLIDIKVGDVRLFDCDILALKFADGLYGADRIVATALGKSEFEISTLLPSVGACQLLDSLGRIKPGQVLFVGVGDIFRFDYANIRKFASDVLSLLSSLAPDMKHLAMTIHGVGYGLDEGEALKSQLAGYFDALENGRFPVNLERITLVEINPERASRLSSVLNKALVVNPLPIKRQRGLRVIKNLYRSPEVSSTGNKSLSKPYVFVTMPINKETEDIFYYGIQSPINSEGFLCEYVDFTSPTIDNINRTMARIGTSSLFVAEVTETNPHVFFAIGYACAKDKPTILLSRTGDRKVVLASGLESIVYSGIRDVETAMKSGLKSL
jgi:hypothetical protein